MACVLYPLLYNAFAKNVKLVGTPIAVVGGIISLIELCKGYRPVCIAVLVGVQ